MSSRNPRSLRSHRASSGTPATIPWHRCGALRIGIGPVRLPGLPRRQPLPQGPDRGHDLPTHVEGLRGSGPSPWRHQPHRRRFGFAENLQIPFAHRFFAGGRTTHRAFDTDRLGIPGQTIVEGSPIGGNALILLNLEYRRRIAGELFAAIFVDAGNVWASPSQVKAGEIRWGPGIGLQYRTPAGPLRVEYAWKLAQEDRREARPVLRQLRRSVLGIQGIAAAIP